jgi:cation:H+ antiporter
LVSRGEGRAGHLVGFTVILMGLGLCVLAFSDLIQLEGSPRLSAGVLVSSIPVILFGCELFTNAVEHIGRIFKLSHQTTGGLFAAVGTALPESSIPVIAVIFGSKAHGEAVGVGAILGAPFMLVTLALALLGLTVLVARARGKRQSLVLSVDTMALRFELRIFLACFVGILVVSLLNLPWLKLIGAVVLVCLYAWYAKYSLGLDAQKGEVYTKVLYLERYAGMPLDVKTVIVQIVAGLAYILAGAKFFVSAVIALAIYMKVSALVLSLILAPLATELPEKYNSVVWALRGQDALAVSNITGAMIFQSMIPVAFGLFFTKWNLGATELINIVFALGAGGLAYFSLLRSGSLKATALLTGGLFYLIYMAGVILNG